MKSVGAASTAIGLALALLAGCGADGAAHEGPERTLVFAAASTASALDEIRERFQQQSGIEVRTSCAGSSALAQQILNGAEADVLITADTKWADYLDRSGLVARRQNLLGNRLVVVVPADSGLTIRKPEDLAISEVQHLALADPEAVPAGVYAKQAFSKLGLWEQLKPRVVAAADVRQALSYVETGAAEAGVVYATDAAASTSVRVVCELPEALTGPIRYAAVLLKHGEGRAAAEAFYEHLNSAEAAKVFKKYGFEHLPRATPDIAVP